MSVNDKTPENGNAKMAKAALSGARLLRAAMDKYYDYLVKVAEIKDSQSAHEGGQWLPGHPKTDGFADARGGVEFKDVSVGPVGVSEDQTGYAVTGTDADFDDEDEMGWYKDMMDGATDEAKKLYEKCEQTFQLSIGAYEKYDRSAPAGLRNGKFYRGWGNSVYVWAVIQMNKYAYDEARRLFETAVAKFAKAMGDNEKDDAIYRRLGNANYELAAISMDSSLYGGAEKYFRAAEKNFKEIKVKRTDDKRNLGNSLFELGRLLVEDYLSRKEYEDETYKNAIRRFTWNSLENACEDVDLDGALGGEFLSTREDEWAVGIDVNWFEGEETGIKEANRLFREAINMYKIIDVEAVKHEEYVDVYRNWGEIHSLWGRLNRFKYLTVLEEIAGLRNSGDAGKAELRRRKEEFAESVGGARKHFGEAVKMLVKAKKFDDEGTINRKEVWHILGAAYYRLGLTYRLGGDKENWKAKSVEMWNCAENVFSKSDETILDSFVALSVEAGYPLLKDTIFYARLDNERKKDGAFFKYAVDGKNDGAKSAEEWDKFRKKCKDVYIHSMYIISRLEVKRENGKDVAHYTKMSTAQHLLFGGRKFGLFAADYFNDPEEGKVLLDYLKGRDWRVESEKNGISTDAWDNGEEIKQDEKKLENEKQEYVTFAGSFSFDYDSLNQFRLYGNEGDRPGSGLSLVFNKTFFREELRQERASSLGDVEEDIKDGIIAEKGTAWWNELKEKSVQFDRLPRRNTLFRCAYLDPKTGRVETVGQKDRYLFYREGIEKRYEGYRKFVTSIVDDVNEELAVMRENVKDLDADTAAQLNLKLRYLIKHIAFKDERECRIVKNCRLAGKDAEEKVLVGAEKAAIGEELRMHLEYGLDVSQHVKRIYFGPKAGGVEMFRKCLVNKGLGGIRCYKTSTHLA
jgi:tetratricopeptide (TPR) repeat protein